MTGPPPPDDYKGNGCGPKTPLGILAWLIPDFEFTEACRWHDWHYELAAGCELPRWYADFALAINTWDLRRGCGRSWLRSSGAALTYFLGVRIFGFGTTLRAWWHALRH